MKSLYLISLLLVTMLISCSEKPTADLIDDQETKQTLTHHKLADLKNFQLKKVSLENADLKQAIENLLKQYRDICLQTDEQPLDISAKFNGDFDSKITLSSQGNFDSVLTQICCLYAAELETNATGYVFSPIAKQGETCSLITRIPLDFNNLLPILKLEEIFNVKTSFDKSSAKLTLNGQESEVVRLFQLIKAATSAKPFQIKTVSKLIRIPSENRSPEIDEMIAKTKPLTAEQIQLITENDSISTAVYPSIVSRSGEPAVIEIVRGLEPPVTKPESIDPTLGKEEDIIWSGDIPAETPEKPTPELPAFDTWIGHQLKTTSDYLGLKIKTKIQHEFRKIDGMDMLDHDGIGKIPFDKNSKIIATTTTYQGNLNSDTSYLIKMNGQADNNDYLLITQTLIDATGKKIQFDQ